MDPNSHICFADDIVFFAEADLNQSQVFSQVLNDFCSSSGQKVNLQKSKVFFSSNVRSGTAYQICQNLGIEKTVNLGSYLGVPLLHQRVDKDSVAVVLDKTRKKLSNWNSSSLSLAGRITLARSCLSCMPNYIMHTLALPASVCDSAEAICRTLFGEAVSQIENVTCYLGTKFANQRKMEVLVSGI